MKKDILIHQSHDHTWSAQTDGKNVCRMTVDSKASLSENPFYFGTLDALLSAIQELNEPQIKEEESLEEKKPIYVSAEAMQSHFASLGKPQGKSSILESKITEASKENGMILVVKANTLPSGAMHEEVDLKGRVLIASVIGNNKEDIERQLTDLNLIDEFDKTKSDTIVELATDILAHHGDLEIV